VNWRLMLSDLNAIMGLVSRVVSGVMFITGMWTNNLFLVAGATYLIVVAIDSKRSA